MSEEGFQEPTEIVVNLPGDDDDEEVKFVQISCGYHHTAVVSGDGHLYTWGRGIFG